MFLVSVAWQNLFFTIRDERDGDEFELCLT